MSAADQTDPVVIVGGGHNGLVAGCYLAKAGRHVLVLEGGDKLGGGSRTDETIPGYLFNTHAAAHNIINMTSIPAELDLAGAEQLPRVVVAMVVGKPEQVSRRVGRGERCGRRWQAGGLRGQSAGWPPPVSTWWPKDPRLPA